MKARRVPLKLRAPRIKEGQAVETLQLKPSSSALSPLSFKPRDLLFLQIIASSIKDLPFFDLPEKYGVQDLAPRGSRGDDQGIPYLLGLGTSCHVVQHETGDDTSEIVPKGSIVALKIYRQEGLDYSAPSALASRQLAQAIWQDLRVLCHPCLRYHENFCRLLYVGWEPYSLVPILALELAAFGSLQDALQSEGELSLLQKCNISMDIALGLDTLHDCGFVHGDIKPSNIMLQTHSERQIVAKILDFSGATDVVTYGTAGHMSYMTKLWLAPEVLLGSIAVNWQKVDVYAYGLVLAHMWSREDMDLIECFLEAHPPRRLTPVEKQVLLLYYKCCPDDAPMSVLNQALRTVVSFDNDTQTTKASISLDLILTATLARDPDQRQTMRSLMAQFENFATSNERPIPVPAGQEHARSTEQELWASASDRNFFHMRVVSGEPLLHKPSFFPGSEHEYEDPYLLWLLICHNDTALDSVPDGEHYQRVLHYQIAACLFQGHGAKVDEGVALEYLTSAALGGIKRAMYMLQQVEASCGIRLPHDFPRMLFLILGHLNGSSEASDILRDTKPKVYNTAQLLLNLIRWEGLGQEVPYLRLVLLPDCEAMRDEENSLSLDIRCAKGDPDYFLAIENEQVAVVETLASQGTDPTVLNHSGLSVLHTLSLISDEVSAKLADTLVAAGAKISCESMEPFAFWKNRVCNGRNTPLIWAIVKGKTRLAHTLLRLDKVFEESSTLYYLSAFALMVQLRRHTMLEGTLEFDNNITKALAGDMRDRVLFDTLYFCTEDYNDGDSIGRRWSLGAQFEEGRKATASLLLKLGANLLWKRGNNSAWPLRNAILKGDAVCVKLYVEDLEAKGQDMLTLMGRSGLFCEGNTTKIFWSALRASLNAPCRQAFLYILDKFPDTIDELSVSRLSPLSDAASEGDAFSVDRLLTRGAKFRPSRQGSSPFVDALCKGDIDVANTIARYLDRDVLLAPNAESKGYNAFGLVLHTYTSGRKHIPLRSFQCLYQLGGLDFMVNTANQETAFRVLLLKGRPTYHEHRAADLRLLRYFLHENIFREHINYLDNTGRSPIHYAAHYVYPEAMELLLDSGADVNLEMVAPSIAGQSRSKLTGWTALDLTVNAHIHGTPKAIKTGGATEIRSYQKRLKRLVILLVDRQGKNGSGAPAMYPMHVQKIVNPSGMKDIHIQYALNPVPGDETWRGAWPSPIPVCPTSASVEESLLNAGNRTQDLESDGKSAPSDLVRQCNIIYRNRKGKKVVTNDRLLMIMGPMIESSSSEEEDEEAEAETRILLKRARSFIAARQAEQSMSELALNRT